MVHTHCHVEVKCHSYQQNEPLGNVVTARLGSSCSRSYFQFFHRTCVLRKVGSVRLCYLSARNEVNRTITNNLPCLIPVHTNTYRINTIYTTKHSFRNINQVTFKMETSSTDAIPTQLLSSNTTTDETNLERLPLDIFLKLVLPFVGNDHYRFQGIFSPNFQNQYCTSFPTQ
jgi:hypothetical protein